MFEKAHNIESDDIEAETRQWPFDFLFHFRNKIAIGICSFQI